METITIGAIPSKPYKDYLDLDVKGVIREPKNLSGKEMTATFLGNREKSSLRTGLASETGPIGVGGFTLKGDHRRFLGSLPFETIHMIAFLLEGKKVKYFQLHGLAPYRGEATIKEIDFFRDYNPDDW